MFPGFWAKAGMLFAPEGIIPIREKDDATMKFVYLLRSIRFPDRRYVGITRDVEKRLADHNLGQSPHTAEFRPWKLVAFIGFEDDRAAARFERYLKSASGRAFAARHFLMDNMR